MGFLLKPGIPLWPPGGPIPSCTGNMLHERFLPVFFFFFFWLHRVFTAACGPPLVVASGGYSLVTVAVFSLWWLLSLRSMGFRVCGFSGCSAWAQ